MTIISIDTRVQSHVTLISSSSVSSQQSGCDGDCSLPSWLLGGWGELSGDRSAPLMILALSASASLRSGWGLFLLGSVCSREPPAASSSRSFELRHFIRRFWNQIFTCNNFKSFFRCASKHSNFFNIKISFLVSIANIINYQML